MKAMIFAAGIGSRLAPLTDERPKALIEVGGIPMIEIVLKRLIAAGVDAAVVNVFHKADQIAAFLKKRENFGIRIELSREAELLDTGGGLKKAAPFFDDEKPFFVHNVDVLTDIDLTLMMSRHKSSGALATLAVQKRESGRHLLFDQHGRLRGREGEGWVEWAKDPAENSERLAFAGIHVISLDLLSKITETGAFSIMRTYLRLAGADESIQAFRADSYYWQDIGSPEKLDAARRRAKVQGLPV